ncbi:hypothetical protein P9847_22895 [Paenibacillus chibensis]|uniref:Uncharacterized protein n=1 Tax=Paenibacillus chibensis TaxID=59846 RepID=A0ABU6Q1A8_9BACL|nr:hypothetical protein [Paenibacillus chibensis]
MIALENPEAIYGALAKIADIADKGSVITRDHGVHILIKLCSAKPYADHVLFSSNSLRATRQNQLPMYAEKAVSIVNAQNKVLFIETFSSRLGDIEKDTKRKRVEKVIKKWS